MSKIIYNGKDAVFGRLASLVAKDLLKGNEVVILNCEEIIISGDKKLLARKILKKRDMGSGSSMKGPKYPRTAERLVKRMIRGMLPWDRMKGRNAYRNLKCFVSGDLEIEKDAQIIQLDHAKPIKYSSIKQVVALLGASNKPKVEASK